MRILCALILLLLATGCGSTIGVAGTTSAGDSVLPPPPIQAIDEPNPDVASLWTDRTNIGETDGGTECFFSVAQVAIGSNGIGDPGDIPQHDVLLNGDDCAKATEEQLAEMAAQQRELHESLRPAAGSTPRKIARLAFGGDGRLELTAWRTQKGELCMDASSWHDGSGGDGPFGPCVQMPHCAELCLNPMIYNDKARVTRYALVAVVPQSADRIDITVRGGDERRYPLTGPLIPGFPRRVFMVDLGRDDYRRIDAYEGEKIIAHEEMDAMTAAFEECSERLNPFPAGGDVSPAAIKAASARFNECLTEAGASGGPLTTTG